MGHDLQILPGTGNRGPHAKDRYFREIRNRYKFLLDLGGERVLLYKRKHTGTRCPNFDQVYKKDGNHETENPPICFGTGYRGGYFKPIEIVVSLISGGQEAAIIEEWGRRRVYTPRSWTLWEPTITNGDFLVKRNGQRLWVVNTYQRKWKHYITRVDLELVEVERNSPIYQIEI